MKALRALSVLTLAFALVDGAHAGTKAVGGTVTNLDGRRIHTFTDVGTSNLTVTSAGYVEVLVVAGGGGGGCLAGGGGAGGLVYSNGFFVEAGDHTVVVGGGGTGSPSRTVRGGNGTNSVFGPLTAIGGGGGGSYGAKVCLPGGSGGGTQSGGTVGTGTPGQGHDGASSASATVGGGGGGAGEAGHAGTSSVAGAGGDGLAYDISGTLTYYAGGGGGGAYTAAPGGLGGGGDGATNASDGQPGDPNTGGGGGGVRNTATQKGGNGGSGIVIVRYEVDDRGAVETGVATSVQTTSAVLTGALVSAGDPACDILVYWGTGDGGSNATAWTNSGKLAGPQPVGAFGLPVSGLTPDSTYYFRAAASNESGVAWAPTSGIFITGEISVAKVSDAAEDGLVSGSFELSRPTTSTNEPVAVLFGLGGTATGGVDYVSIATNVVLQAGVAETTVTITPLVNWSNPNDSTVVLTVLPGAYAVGTPGSASLTITNYDIPTGKNVWIAPTAGNASVASNWSLNRVPEAGDDILLTGFSTADLVWDAAATDVVGSWRQEPDYTGTVTFQTVYGDTGFTNFMVTGNAELLGGAWTHGGNTDAETYRLAVSVGGDLLVDGGTINVDARGYDKSKGPGLASTLDGGGHGGMGGDFYLDGTGGTTYGSLYAPINLGSGGGTGKGGGAMLLTVSGTTTVSGSGAVSANGADGGDGSGAGGSVWLTTGTLVGDGTVRANGGSQLNFSTTNRGAGGGGRIAVVLTDAESDFSAWSGDLQALGGLSSTSYRHGAAGTIYLKLADGSDTLIVDNNGTTNPDMVRTQLPETPAVDLSAIGEVRIAGGSLLAAATSTSVDFGVDNLAFLAPTAALAITNDTNVVFPSDWFVTNGTVMLEGVSPTLGNVTIGAGGTLTHRENMGADVYGLALTLSGNLTLVDGGRICADAKGYASRNGPGFYNGDYSGGAYGGGAAGLYDRINNATYGSILDPADIGSGGVGGRGGGRVVLAVAGATVVDAVSAITAHGQVAADGGGSGGTIRLTTGTLTGVGTIAANGASSGLTRGGGGGGRVAVRLTGSGAGFGGWTGLTCAYGGPNDNTLNQGAAGTVYLQAANQAEGAGAVLIDNANLAFDATPPSTILPAHVAATDELGRTDWTVQRKSRLMLVADAAVNAVGLASDSILDLGGFTLTLGALVLNGESVPAGDYTAVELGAANVVDSVGGGSVQIRGRGTLLLVR